MDIITGTGLKNMGQARIIYIDDEVDLLELASSFFEDESLPIETCSDFNEALSLLKSNEYDLVITDAKMPTGSGYDLIKFLKSDASFKGKIVLATGSLQDAGNSLGYDVVVQKPIDFMNLIDTAKRLLNI